MVFYFLFFLLFVSVCAAGVSLAVKAWAPAAPSLVLVPAVALAGSLLINLMIDHPSLVSVAWTFALLLPGAAAGVAIAAWRRWRSGGPGDAP